MNSWCWGVSENSWCWGSVWAVGVVGNVGSWCWGSVRTVGVGGQ